MPDIPDSYDIANDSEFRFYARFALPPRPGKILSKEVNGSYTVSVDDQDGGTVTAWPLNAFVYAVDDIVYIAYASNTPDSAIILGSYTPAPNMHAITPYGGMYQDEVPTTITISAAGTYYDIDGMTTGLVDGFVFQNAKELKCVHTGKYKVDWSLSITGTAHKDIEALVMINSTPQHWTESQVHLQTTNERAALGGTGIIQLATDDLVKLALENETDTANVVVDHANLSLVRVG